MWTQSHPTNNNTNNLMCGKLVSFDCLFEGIPQYSTADNVDTTEGQTQC
jgi:hypothetical protein